MKIIKSCIALGLLYASSSAITLNESVSEVINTHPQLKERIRNYRATKQDMSIADSDYLPSIDYTGAIGHKENGFFYDDVKRDGYNQYQNTLSLTWNLFRGWGTLYQVGYEEARTLAAAYNYVEKANDISYRMVEAYINYLRANELYLNSKEKVKSNENIYAKVHDLYINGLAARSEVDKIQSSLALARSNVTVRRNNLRDAQAKFRRILGRNIPVEQLEEPKLDVALPESKIRALEFAIKHNPSMLVADYNIKGAQQLYNQRKSNYYPTIDLELEQNLNNNLDNFTGHDDRFQAMLVLRYNIYKGGADSANTQKHISKINQEIDLKREIKREVIESLELSWSAYRLISQQLDDLYKFQSFSFTTLELYNSEYELGQRSLLDLLSAQNDFYNSKEQIISAEYDFLFSKYRVLDAMGVMVLAIEGVDYDYTSIVGIKDKSKLNSDTNSSEDNSSIEDVIPVKLDVDNDYILDSEDLCDNTIDKDRVMSYGCIKYNGDEDDDGVKDNLDQCPHTPQGLNVDYKGCPATFSLNILFDPFSNEVSKDSKAKIEQFARFLKENSNYNALIEGHTDDIGTIAENLDLSNKRAASVKDMLVKLGVEEYRLHSIGKGESEPIADNSTPEGRAKNRRIDVKLSTIGEKKVER